MCSTAVRDGDYEEDRYLLYLCFELFQILHTSANSSFSSHSCPMIWKTQGRSSLPRTRYSLDTNARYACFVWTEQSEEEPVTLDSVKERGLSAFDEKEVFRMCSTAVRDGDYEEDRYLLYLCGTRCCTAPSFSMTRTHFILGTLVVIS